MTDLTPNTTPKGERCGTCRFAGTHTTSTEREDQVVVRCRRFPPVSREFWRDRPALAARVAATHWAYTEWDDWCGEWEDRDPEPDQDRQPAGFQR